MNFLSPYKIYVDVETTALSAQKGDVIVSSLIVADLDRNELAARTFYIKPMNPQAWDPGAEKIHKIPIEKALAHTDTPMDILYFLKPYYVPDKYAEFISHSLNGFDFNFMEWLYRKNQLEYSFWKMFHGEHTSSTILKAREKLQLPNFKLNTICEHFSISLDHHNAESDVRACYEIDKRLA